MPKRFILPLAVLVLAGCTSDANQLAGVDMTLDSEGCRATAASGADASDAAQAQTTLEKKAAFDQIYRACMAGKGYTLHANAR
ncbi:MAG TPA: hypothetical protein VNU97_18735 [Rhizomicrobium sp.]|jgi:hypothetical protein|nr:hypothetical protein [Rhizomicrobium sp.]